MIYSNFGFESFYFKSAFADRISEFFAEGDLIEVSEDTRELLNYWSTLSQKQKENLLTFIKNYDK